MSDSIDPGLALQDIVESTAMSDTAVKALFAGGDVQYYRHTAPNGAPFPYIIANDYQVLGDDTECASSSEIVNKLHVFAQGDTLAAAGILAGQIAAALRRCLTRRLGMAGHKMDDWQFDSILALTEPDGLTAHHVVQHTYLTTALTS